MSEYGAISEYYKQIKSGEEIAGKKIIQAYEFVLEGLTDKRFFYDAKKAGRAVRFIENFCHHSRGRWAPGLVKLEPWQKAGVESTFGVVDENELRQFREVLWVVGRKCGKSILASGEAEYMAYADGEMGGEVYFLAPKLDQANIVFDDFWKSIQCEPDLMMLTEKKRDGLHIPATNTLVRMLAFSQKKSDGFNPSCVINDELAAWRGDAGIKQYGVMASALGARSQPLMLSITTANYSQGGIYDSLLTRASAVLNGTSEEKRFLPLIYQIDDPAKWNDIRELKKSLPNLGVSVSEDFIREEIAKAETDLGAKNEFLTKYCNLVQNSATAWLDAKTIEKACGEELHIEDFTKTYCVAGIDLSKSIDLTSACVVVEKNGELYVFSHFWMPAGRLEKATAEDGVPYEQYIKRGWLSLSGENHIDYHDCYEWLKTVVEKFQCLPLQVGFDRYSARFLIDELLKPYGFLCDDVYQGYNLSPVIDTFYGMMMDGKVHIGNNQLLKMHLYNAALKVELETQKKRLVKLGSRLRIDGVAALLDAMTVREKWWGEIGERLKNGGR